MPSSETKLCFRSRCREHALPSCSWPLWPWRRPRLCCRSAVCGAPILPIYLDEPRRSQRDPPEPCASWLDSLAAPLVHFVELSDEAVKELDPEGGVAFWHRCEILVDPRHARDVETTAHRRAP